MTAKKSTTKRAKKTTKKTAKRAKSPRLKPKKHGRPKKVVVDEASLTATQKKRRSEMFSAWSALETRSQELAEEVILVERQRNEVLAAIEKEWGNGPFSIGGSEHFISSNRGRYFLKQRSVQKAPEVL